MSDYSQVTNFTVKDGLASGTAAKLVKGSDFDAEFAAISTAIASKADDTLTADLNTSTYDINFSDTAQANFGDANDLSIYHDASNSYINDTGTGGLILKSSDVTIQNASGTEILSTGIGTGVEITGTLDIDQDTASNHIVTIHNTNSSGTGAAYLQIKTDTKYVNLSVTDQGDYAQEVGSSILTKYVDYDTHVFRSNGGTEIARFDSTTGLTLKSALVDTTYAWTSTSGSVTGELNPANGGIQTVTLTGNITALTDNVASGEGILLMIDDGTAYTITWPTMTWVNNGGLAPTLETTGYTVVALWKVSTTLYGSLISG